MTDYAGQRLERHLAAIGVKRDYLTDAQFSATIKLLRTYLRQVEHAMREEGVPEGIIKNVIDKLVWGSVSSGEMAQVEQEIVMAKSAAEMPDLALPARFAGRVFPSVHHEGDPRDETEE